MEGGRLFFRRDDLRANKSALDMAPLVVPAHVLRFFGDTLPIFALEFSAIALSLFEWKFRTQCATIALYTDNTGAFGAVLNTGSSEVSVSRETTRLWYLIDQFQISLWLEPVAPNLNIADLPTRDKPSHFPIHSVTTFPFSRRILPFPRRFLYRDSFVHFRIRRTPDIENRNLGRPC